MIRYLATIATVLALTLGLSAMAHGLEAERHASPNGYEFIFVPMPDKSQVVFRFVWEGGYAFVPEGKETIKELAPFMLVNAGSEGLGPDELIGKFDALGGGMRIYSGSDAFYGLLYGTSENLSETAALMNTVLAKPTMDARWLRRFQRNFVENMNQQVLTPNGQAWRTIRDVVMDGHPLSRAWSNTPIEEISQITVDDLKDWHRRTVTSDGVKVFVAGNADPADLGAAIDIALAGLPSRSGRQNYPPVTMTYAGKTILVHKPEIEKSHIIVAGPLPPFYGPNQEALEIGIGVLGVSDQSRLFTAIRKELRATYGFRAWSHEFTDDHVMLHMQGEVETSKIQQVLKTIEATYEDFREGGIGLVEFPFASRIYRNRAKDQVQDAETVTNWLSEAWLTGRSYEHALSYPARASNLSRGPVNEVIGNVFPPYGEMIKIIVTPDADAVKADCVITDYTDAARCR